MEAKEYVSISFYRYKIKIDGNVDWSSKQLVKILDLPRWLYQLSHCRHRISWILSNLRYKNIRFYVNIEHAFYCKKTGIDLGFNSAYTKFVSCKGVITKYENKLKKYKEQWQPSIFCTDISQDEKYNKAIQKINAKKFELRQLEIELSIEKEKLQN